MSTTTSHSAKQAGRVVLAQAKQRATSPWVTWLERFGFLIRGVIYIVIGLLALQLALGAGGQTTSPTGAIAWLGHQSYGQWVLVLVVVGLAGYALWGFVRAILDPLGHGNDAKGLIDRAGFLFSGISYALLAIGAAQTLMNQPGKALGSVTGVPASLMAGPWGKWLVIGFGVFWLVAGIGQLISAYSKHFLRDLRMSTMSAQEIKTATWLGQAGYTARGIVFGLIGLIVLQTALAGGSQHAQGFDGALAALQHAPYGQALLGAVALGLLLFGIFSAMCAKWVRIGASRLA
jgi:hypothetical protein